MDNTLDKLDNLVQSALPVLFLVKIEMFKVTPGNNLLAVGITE